MSSFVKNLLVVTVSIFFSIIIYKISYAASGVIFSEVSMGTTANVSDEFIELYNSSGSNIDISGWQISYKSATGTTWTKKAIIDNGKLIKANQYFLLASLIDADMKMSSGLAQSGGNIRIADKSGNIVDQFAWGNGDKSLVKPALSCQPSESLQRIYNQDGLGLQNTSNNFDDYDISSSPTPNMPPQFDQQSSDSEEQIQNQSYPQLFISELYPNPDSSQSDSSDEFIELYNPNNFEVDLSGWSLRDSGNTSYKFENQKIAANSFLAVFSRDIPISLNNDGDSISLLNPLAQIVDQTPNYGDAQEGLSWGLTPAGWGWTQTPTPNTSNSSLYVFNENSKGSSTKSKAKSNKSNSSKAKTNKKGPKLASIGKTPSSLASEDDKSINNNLWNILLIALGLGTIGYGVYEYRSEIKNYYHIAKRKLGLGPKIS